MSESIMLPSHNDTSLFSDAAASVIYGIDDSLIPLAQVYSCAAARRGTIVEIGIDRVGQKIDIYGDRPRRVVAQV